MNVAAIMKKIPRFFRRRKLVDAILFFSPNSRIQQIELQNGATLFTDISDRFPKSYFLSGNFDQEFLDTAAFFLAKGGVFFDAGANFGFYSFGLMAEIPEANVDYHLFEANSEMCGLLKRSAELQNGKKIKVAEACLTDQKGFSRLYIKKGHLSGSYICDKGTQPVQNLLLDEYMSGNGIAHVDFMKMDIEGYEFPALKGACVNLERGNIKVIYLEASDPNHENLPWKLTDCLDLLKRKGFKLFYVKKVDFEKGYASVSLGREFERGGRKLFLSPLEVFPKGHQTDILAVHHSSGFQF